MIDLLRVRERSAAIFNNMYLLEAGAFIAGLSDGEFTQTNAARALGIDRNQVNTALRHLEKAYLIKRLPDRDRERPFQRQPSAFWALCQALLEEM